MRPVRVNCICSGNIEISSAEVLVRWCVDNNTAAYAFVCPRCSRRECVDFDERSAQLLLAAGARLETWRMPTEVLEHQHGPRLTAQFLDDCLAILEDDDRFELAIRTLTDTGHRHRQRLRLEVVAAEARVDALG